MASRVTRFRSLAPVLCALLAGPVGAREAGGENRPRVLIELCREGHGTSRGLLLDARGALVHAFPVGYGRAGWLEEGSRFRDGFSLLGKFRINAILTPDRCELSGELLRRSGRDTEFLRRHLFANMDSIDFDGDGRGGEYGGGYLSLEPVAEDGDGHGRQARVVQPFAFCHFKGVFRWYSFAIHGTQDAARVGRAATGGCINVGEEALALLLESLQLGDAVEIVEATGRGASRKGSLPEGGASEKR